jgi:hypothetical protein
MFELFEPNIPKCLQPKIQENSRFLEPRLGDRRINPLRAGRGSAFLSQCLNGRACRCLRQQTGRVFILNPMDESETIDEISRIEAQLEKLAEVSERCRKIALVSRVAIAGGVALPILTMLGLFESNEVAAIGSIAVVLGGIVSLGSNASTLRETTVAINLAEALRSDLISRIDLRVVSEG